MTPAATSKRDSTGIRRNRPSYSCTECTRRKLRCSKKIPCSACTERGVAHTCKRRSSNIQKTSQVETIISPTASSGTLPVSPSTTEDAQVSLQDDVSNINGDAAVMLEFLALNRQQVIQAAQLEEAQLPEASSLAENSADLLFPAYRIRCMMHYHQMNLAWVHNVVHMPTFIAQCERAIYGNKMLEPSWYSLYYAMIAVRRPLYLSSKLANGFHS